MTMKKKNALLKEKIFEHQFLLYRHLFIFMDCHSGRAVSPYGCNDWRVLKDLTYVDGLSDCASKLA